VHVIFVASACRVVLDPSFPEKVILVSEETLKHLSSRVPGVLSVNALPCSPFSLLGAAKSCEPRNRPLE
jgi:hypothetical protein